MYVRRIVLFLTLLGQQNFHEFLNFLCKFMLSFSKALENNWSHALTPNIREVMKFYNLGDQSLERDFGTYEIECTGSRY